MYMHDFFGGMLLHWCSKSNHEILFIFFVQNELFSLLKNRDLHTLACYLAKSTDLSLAFVSLA